MIIIIVNFLIIIIISILSNPNTLEYFNKEACSNNINDREYLEHMIPHHQVAIDMSLLLPRKTKNPTMQNIIRKLIWIQKYEVEMMKHFLKAMPVKSSAFRNMNRYYIATISDFTKPNKVGLSSTYCDPLFFDPKKHMNHMKHMKINDEMYIKHMIPHHQVAVDMSKKLLKNTNNDFMINLAYRIIRSQQEEIIILSDLLKKNNVNYQSNII